ncbi:MAG: hypothetical protein ACMVP2_27425 [Imperialibacter sp.]|uniref:hypothetical protein n=1 Tax=Imperialibacter sp. TaxID=2038411 RepID=UPI0030DB9E03|tara:strand:+ start:1778 stop:2359 length:582 start_codon:yes stop_codon:yes gene_type:complete
MNTFRKSIPTSLRRITAISLLFLFLLNIIGFYGVFMGLKYNFEQQVVSDLDSDNFNEEELVEFKVAVSLAYMPDQANYERVDGLIEVEGKFYRLVKQKYAADTLYIVCLPDHNQQKLHEAIEDYVSTFTAPDASTAKQVDFSKSLSKDYMISNVTMERASYGSFYSVENADYVVSNYIFYLSIQSPPPRGILV